MQKNQPIAIDLFCGAGGLSLGFEQAGFNIAVAIDVDEMNTRVHKRNFPSCKTLTKDVRDVCGQEIRFESGIDEEEIDVVIGGPPCQGFSIMGKREADDPRNLLLFEFGRIVKELRPRYWVMENVSGLLIGSARVVLASFVDTMKEAGYNVVEPLKLLSAEKFGVPQKRQRIFIIGYQSSTCPPSYPEPIINSNRTSISNPTVWDAIADLYVLDARGKSIVEDNYTGKLGVGSAYAKVLRGETSDPDNHSLRREKTCHVLTGCHVSLHEKQVVGRFSKTRPGSYEPVSKFYRLTKKGLSNTLRAGTERSRGGFTAARPIHPVVPRCITVREAARLHSFPDWFCFDPTTWGGFRHVGNSVPPLLARAVGLSIQKAIIHTPNKQRTYREKVP